MEGRCLFGIMGRCPCADIGFASLCCGIISALSGETFLLLHLKIFGCCVPLLLDQPVPCAPLNFPTC